MFSARLIFAWILDGFWLRRDRLRKPDRSAIVRHHTEHVAWIFVAKIVRRVAHLFGRKNLAALSTLVTLLRLAPGTTVFARADVCAARAFEIVRGPDLVTINVPLHIIATQADVRERPLVANGPAHLPEKIHGFAFQAVEMAKALMGLVPLLHTVIRFHVRIM